jgi:hypothetical protein
MLDDKLIQTVRTKYQLDMKKSVVMLSKILDDKYISDKDVISEVDKQLKSFANAKERATHFEAIIKTLSDEIEITKEE